MSDHPRPIPWLGVVGVVPTLDAPPVVATPSVGSAPEVAKSAAAAAEGSAAPSPLDRVARWARA